MNNIEDNLKDKTIDELIAIINRQEEIINKACLYLSLGELAGVNALDIKKELSEGFDYDNCE